jgi:hypothetical protein
MNEKRNGNIPELCDTQYDSFPLVQWELCHLACIAWWVDNLGFPFLACRLGVEFLRSPERSRKETKGKKGVKKVHDVHDGVRVREYCIDMILCPAGVGHNKGRAGECQGVVIH